MKMATTTTSNNKAPQTTTTQPQHKISDTSQTDKRYKNNKKNSQQQKITTKQKWRTTFTQGHCVFNCALCCFVAVPSNAVAAASDSWRFLALVDLAITIHGGSSSYSNNNNNHKTTKIATTTPKVPLINRKHWQYE